MGILYFEVEAKYDELIKLRQQLAGLEQQMLSISRGNMTDLTALQKQYGVLSQQIAKLTQEAATNGERMRQTFAQMSKASTGIASNSSNVAKSATEFGQSITTAMTEGGNATEIFGSTLGNVNGTLGKLLNLTNGLGTAIGTTFGVGAIASFLNKVQEVRTYFQDIESSMKVFLGDEAKATEFTNELKDYAYYNMFEFSELAQGAKQLIAFGNATDDVIPILDKLSNVASGTGGNINELIYLFNKAKSTGRVMARDVQSWASKGIVLRDELKAMGVEASEGAISFEQLNKVLEKVTGEGGQFHNLMMEQMNNLSASKGQLQDNMDAMFNEIGEKLQPILKGSIDLASNLVDNYESVGKAILTMASAYGVYRTVLGVANALRSNELKTLQEYVRTNITGVKVGEESLSVRERETREIKKQTEAYYEQIAARRRDIEAQKASNISDMVRTSNKLSDIEDELENATLSDERRQQLIADHALLQQEYDGFKQKTAELTEAGRSMDEFVESTKEANEGVNMLGGALGGLKAKMTALASNPFVWITAAIVGTAVVLYKLGTALSFTERGYNSASEEISRYNALLEYHKETAQSAVNTINDVNKSIFEQEEAYERLIALYPKLKEMGQTELMDMDVDKLKETINTISDEQRANDINSNLEATRKKVQELQTAYDEMAMTNASSSFNYGGTGSDAHRAFIQLSQDLEYAKGELNAYEDEYKKFSEAIRKTQMKALSAEDRVDVLEQDKNVARQVLDVYNNLFESIKGYNEDTATDIQNGITEQVNGIEQKYAQLQKDLQDNANDPKKTLIIKAEMEKYDKLKNGLLSILSNLQSMADKSPIVVAFGMTYSKNDDRYSEAFKGRGNKENRQLLNAFNKERQALLKDVNATEDDFALLYDRYINLFEDTIVDDGNIDKSKPTVIAMQAFIAQLRSDKNNGVAMMTSGMSVAESIVANETQEAENDLRNASTAYLKAEGKFKKLDEQVQSARETYENDYKAWKAEDDKRRRGEKYDTENFEKLTTNKDTSKKTYESILKQRNYYVKQSEALRAQEIKDERKAQDREFEIRSQNIKSMRDGSDKTLEQIRLDFDKRKTEIQRGYDDIIDTEAKAAEELAKKNPDYVEGSFNTEAFRKNYVYSQEDIDKKAIQDEANVVEFIRKVADISKEYQTNAEKKEQKRLKIDEDILSIDEQIATIRESMTDSTREEGEYAIANLEKRKELAEKIKEQLGYDPSRAEYYEQYGTARQKKQAISDKYDYQIAEAGDDYFKVRKLTRDKVKEVSQIEIEALKELNNWTIALGPLGDAMPEYVMAARDAIKAELDSPRFKTLPPDQQKALYDIYRQINEKAGYRVFGGIKEASERLEQALEHRQALMDMEAKYEEEINAKYGSIDNLLQQAQSGDIEAEGLLNRYNSYNDAREDADTQVGIAEKNLEDRLGDTTGALTDFCNGLQKLTSKNLYDIWQGMKSIAKGLNLGEIGGKWGGIIGAILQIIDLLKDQGLGDIIEHVLTLIGDVFGKILEEIGNGELLEKVVDGLVNLIGGIMKGLAKGILGSYSDWIEDAFKTGAEAFNELVEKTNRLSDAMGNAIDILEQKIEEGTSEESINAYNKAIEYQNELLQNQQKVMSEWLSSNSKGKLSSYFTGSLSQYDKYYKGLETAERKLLGSAFGISYDSVLNAYSNYKTIRKKYSNVEEGSAEEAEIKEAQTQYNRALSQYKSDIEKSLVSFGSMTNKEIEDFIVKHPDVWAILPTQYKEYINALMDIQQKEEELTDKINEKLLGITFDSMYDSFCNTMMDMEKTSYDTASDISEIFYKAFMQELFNDTIKDEMKALYKDMSELAQRKKKGDISDAEYKRGLVALQQRYKTLADNAVAGRNEIAELTGYDEAYTQSQSATSKGFQAMTQEQGTELNGRFTALQMSGERISGGIDEISTIQLPNLNTKLETLIANIGGDSGNPLHNIVKDVQNLLSQSLVALMGIENNTTDMLELFGQDGYMRNAIDTIKKNTEGLRK